MKEMQRGGKRWEDLDRFKNIKHYSGKNDEWEEIWDLWGRQMQPLSATAPLMTGVGNHEVFYNWAAFENRFTMPASPGSNKNVWFSFDLGNVHVLSFR